MEKYEIELLSPLFYNSSPDSGASGASVTYDWIGDLALDYAINFSRGIYKTKFKYNSHKPDYSEIRNFNFITSIAYSNNNVNKTRIYDCATSFLSDGYFPAKIINKSERSPFRNWIKRQGLEPGNKFYFYVLSKNKMELPDNLTIRLGNMKSCLAICRRCKRTEKNKSDKLWINLFTAKIINHIEPEDFGINNITYFSDRYVIKKGVDPDFWRELINGYT